MDTEMRKSGVLLTPWAQGSLEDPTLPPFPFSDPLVRTHSGTNTGKAGQLKHSYSGPLPSDVTVNRAQLSALMAKDCRLLASSLAPWDTRSKPPW